MRLAIGILMASAALCGAEPPKPEPVSKNLEPLQGTWKVTSVESGGEVTAPDQMPGIVIKGDELTVSFGDGEAQKKYFIEVDSGKNPKTINTFTTEVIGISKENGQEVRRKFTGKHVEAVGIYAIDGKTLKLCLLPWTDKEERPTRFVTKGKPDQMLYVLTRQE